MAILIYGTMAPIDRMIPKGVIIPEDPGIMTAAVEAVDASA